MSNSVQNPDLGRSRGIAEIEAVPQVILDGYDVACMRLQTPPILRALQYGRSQVQPSGW